jgi:glycosyltransferase involved in cell wall biosynthesis
MRRTVIYVLEASSISGGVRVVYEHLNHLRARGWHVEVYSLDGNRPTWFPLNPNIPWVKFGNYDHLARHLSTRDAAKCATWWKTALPVAGASKPGEGFYFVQDVESNYYTAPSMKRAVTETYKLPLVKFTDSICAEDEIPNCPFIGLGIDLDLYRPIDGIRRQVNGIMSLSRPQRLKGWSLYCEAYRRLYHSRKFTLYSFGTAGVHPPYSSALPRGISDEELVKFYNRVGIFLSTSVHEGFSLTPLEAMACGATVVTTNAGGNMVYARHGENCLVVPNDAQAIVDTCLGMIEDIDLLVKLQEGGFETVREWPWEPVIDQLEEIYGS